MRTMPFLLLNNLNNIRCGHVRKFSPLSFGQYIYKIWLEIIQKIDGIPMGTYCAPLFADVFLFCYERDSMLSLSDNTQTDII